MDNVHDYQIKLFEDMKEYLPTPIRLRVLLTGFDNKAMEKVQDSRLFGLSLRRLPGATVCDVLGIQVPSQNVIGDTVL